ncbi:MAG: hypothetical protein EA398_13500 [Deltaproteobacteria bacterium]|nr:MAG: hypothetical protein EA398_13500 [Deltaproteobacteria bacterium]
MRRAFYRMVGARPVDPALNAFGASQDDVANELLTEGAHEAQRFMIGAGYHGWMRRFGPLVLDEDDEGRFAVLPVDFLTAQGWRRQSALEDASGRSWGKEADGRDPLSRGNVYWIPDYTTLRFGRGALVPTEVYLRYHYFHPTFGSSEETVDFPPDARRLVVCMAAQAAVDEDWVPGQEEAMGRIDRALAKARQRARRVAVTSKRQRQVQEPPVFGTRW